MSNTPPPLPRATLNYATPVNVVIPNTSGAWFRDGQLVATRECTLPPICVKCGQPATSTLSKKFFWHEPWVYILILPGILIYAICAMVLRKQSKLVIGMCETHRKSRIRRILICWGIFLLGLLMLAAGIAMINRAMGGEWEEVGLVVFLLSLLVFIIAAVMAAILVPLVKPKKIDNNYAWYNGASPEFLRQLPQS